MKTLFIWNNDSKNYIEKLNQFNDLNDYIFVTNEYDFIIKLKNLDDSFSNIFILVELNWDDNIFKGYELANLIVQKWENEDNPPNIEFFSFLTQISLFNLTKNIEKFFAKSFTHNTLPYNKAFSLKPYSKSKWKYLKKYALTEFGILNRISHTITSSINKEDVELQKNAIVITKQLKHLTSIVGDEISKLINDKTQSRDKAFLLDLNKLIIKRIRVINLSDNSKENTNNKEIKNKKRLLLLEDDNYYAQQITEKLDSHFEVIHFNDGAEALLELTNHKFNYSVLVADLELLEADNKLDQKVQGIEVVDYVREHIPHIAWRILTGLPRKGVRELVDVELNNILHKNQLDYFGYNEGMDEFIKKLKKQVERNVYLINMNGPTSAFWDEKTRQGGEGGKFKRFYYDLLNSYPDQFDKMWYEISGTIDNVYNSPETTKISTQIISPKGLSNWLLKENLTLEDKISELKKVLIHRLIFFINYTPGETVIYLDTINDCYSTKPFWNKALSKNSKAYTPILGFGTKNLQKTSEKVTFTFDGYGQLFNKEINILKKYENTFEDFYEKNEDFCYDIDLVHTIIIEDQKKENSQFEQDYSNQKENIFDIDLDYSKNILKSLIEDSKRRSSFNSMDTVKSILREFKYGRELSTEQSEYLELNFELKNLIDLLADN